MVMIINVIKDVLLIERHGIPHDLLQLADGLLGKGVPYQLVISSIINFFTWIVVLIWSVSNRSFLGLFVRCPPRDKLGGNVIDVKIKERYEKIVDVKRSDVIYGIHEKDFFVIKKTKDTENIYIEDDSSNKLPCGGSVIIIQKRDTRLPGQRTTFPQPVRQILRDKLVLIEEDVPFDSKDLAVLCSFVKSLAFVRAEDKICYHPISTEDKVKGGEGTMSVWTRVWAVVLSALCYEITYVEGGDSAAIWVGLLVSSRIYADRDVFKKLLVRSRLDDPTNNMNLEQTGLVISSFADGLYLSINGLLAMFLYMARSGFQTPMLRSFVASPVGAFVIYDMLSLAADMDKDSRPMACLSVATFVSAVCWGAGSLLFLQVRFVLLIPAVVFPCISWLTPKAILNERNPTNFVIYTTCGWFAIHYFVLTYLGQEYLWPSLYELSMKDLMLPITLAKDGKEFRLKLDWEWPIHAFVVLFFTGIVLHYSVGQVTRNFSPHTRWRPPTWSRKAEPGHYFGHLDKTWAISPVVLMKDEKVQSFHLYQDFNHGGLPRNASFDVATFPGNPQTLQWIQ